MDHARRFGAEIVSGDAIALGLDSDPKYVTTKDSFIEAGAVILARGNPFPRERMIPGEDRLTGLGVSYCATCDGPLYRGADVAAYGHSDEAVEDVRALGTAGLPGPLDPRRQGRETRPLRIPTSSSARGSTSIPASRSRRSSEKRRVEKSRPRQGETVARTWPWPGCFIFREIPDGAAL